MSEEMTREQARDTLRNAAWLGTNEDRERIERAVELLCGEPCEDAISRQAAINVILTKYTEYERLKMLHFTPNIIKQECADLLTDLPSVTPKPKTGYWIKGKYRDTCSECRYTTKADRVMGDIVYDFCPFCGVKMIGSEE